MKSPLVRELKANEVATAVFLVQNKEIRRKRTGEPYLSLQLSDSSGEIDSKMWDNVSEVMDTFDRDDFIKVKGILQIYNSRPQFTVHKLRLALDHEVDFADFFPASRRDPEEMWRELRGMVAEMKNPHLRELLDAFLDDPAIATRYKIAPAAKSIHHAFRSGLLEHVLSLANLAKLIAPHYRVDPDLVLTGVVLHDIGKIEELTYERGFGYSVEGQLIGHISIGMRMMASKLTGLPGFPPELRNLVEHLILSHHGQLEFGSPRLPAFPEALLLHYLDDMDSKMECMRALIEKEPQAEGLFTPYSSSLERVALRKSRYICSETEPGDADQAAPSMPVNSADPPVHSGNGTSTVNSGAPSAPNPQPAPSGSLFGSKLFEALNNNPVSPQAPLERD